MDDKRNHWNKFCKEQLVMQSSVPLFQTSDDLYVETFPYGRNMRLVLRRSKEMEQLVIKEVKKVTGDFHQSTHQYDGLIYMIFWESHGEILPLYIGKSEKFGLSGGNLSANIKGIETDSGKFCRWGYNYAYHIGDLSAVVCFGHDSAKKTSKYENWAARLFTTAPSEHPQLKQQTYFWIAAWQRDSVGPWIEYGATPLSFLECLLIALASEIYPDYLLNSIGVNHK